MPRNDNDDAERVSQGKPKENDNEVSDCNKKVIYQFLLFQFQRYNQIDAF